MMVQELIKDLFHTLTLSELQLMNKNYYDGNMSYNSLLYIDLIYYHEGEYTASKIADELCVSKPAVIMKINELIEKGYLYKQQDTKDKRNYYLYTTDKIKQEYDRYRSLDNQVAAYLENKYDDKQLAQFKMIFDDMCNTYINICRGKNNGS
ncbi:MAG: MarR family transcriptional regulator [Erysipelotrichaceae bacterium]|nr:MarR family transcriptional regulator [Erysipelotrichaceae bacterium]MDY5252152.1 MarR family transcriptional regulator [Erysipelotrichaceae bacterium]